MEERAGTRIERLKAIVSNLPTSPGCYQYYDSDGKVIYVGKAKNLKSRVSSYFHKEVDRFKTKVLVSKIEDISYTIVNSEEDALLLENNLIKKYKPKYNILLKDGKTYPSICVTKEYYPRVFKTRIINKNFATYFGPYSHVGSMYAILDLIKKLYKPRTCRFPITQEGINQGKYKACLEYHIHNCEAPCIAKQSHEDYIASIEEAKEILKGNTRELSKSFFSKMQLLASQMRFEEAEELKQKYLLIENFRAKSEVVSNTINNVDVITIENDEKVAYINYMHVNNGSIDQTYTFEIKKKLSEEDEEILQQAILQIREKIQSTSKEIIVEKDWDIKLEDVNFIVPKRGDKKKLLDLSILNGKQYRFDRLKQQDKLNPEQKNVRIMKEIQTCLKLEKLPYRIEMFDNSNISGTDAVASCVVFNGMKPSKKDYRKYNIKTVIGSDDYASMQEVVLRRYERLKKEEKPLPDLIITDGGVGQMNAVRKVVFEELKLNIPIAGLAKDNRHRTNELLFGFPPKVIGMKQESELFRLLTHLQDEAHRFAIEFHRDKRSKRALHSELDEIKGIAEKSKALLIGRLKTVKRIKEADIEELTNILGKSKGEKVYNYFKQKK